MNSEKRVREAWTVFDDIMSEAEQGKISWNDALIQMSQEFRKEEERWIRQKLMKS